MNKTKLAVGLVAVLAGIVRADFTVGFADYAAGETLSNRGAKGGAWSTLPSSVATVVREDANVLVTHSDADPQRFAFANSIATACSCYDFKAVFDVAAELDYQEPNRGLCRVTLAQTDDGLAFALAANGSWHVLVGFVPTCGTLYDLRLETLVADGHTHASLLVKAADGGYLRLADAQGIQWFPLAAKAKTSATALSFAGDGGFSDFAGAARTTADLDASRPQAGQALTVVPKTFDGIDFSVTSCDWYRGTPMRAYAAEPIASGLSYAPTAADDEHWLKVVARSGDAVAFSREFYFSSLPVMYLATDDGATPTEEKEEHGGTLFVQGVAKGYDGAMKIKVRGNTTRLYPKKPWKIKLDSKAEMLGMPKSKHWVLLANYNDESAMRNHLAYDFANQIGSLGMRSEWVECVLNGEWQGLYLLCEHIRVDKNRVNIFSWEDEAEKRGIDGGDEDFRWVTEDDDISGGYLFEASGEFDEESKFWIMSRSLDLPVMVNTPEFLRTNPRMMDWCQNYIQNFCDATTAFDGRSNEGLRYTEYCDLDSMATYFLVMEMFGNDDAEKKSRYFYKDRGEKMKFGPVWDFDWGVGNDTVDPNIFQPESWRTLNHASSFFRVWSDDPQFCHRIHALYWRTARAPFAAMLGDDGLIETYKARLAAAGAANDSRWRLVRGFAADAEHLRDFLTRRLAWLDAQFKDVPTLERSLWTATGSGGHPKGYLIFLK